MINFITIGIALLRVVTIVMAHPGATDEELRAELKVRNDYIASLENNNLLHCAKILNKRDGSGSNELESIANRRMRKVKALRRDLGLSEDGSFHRIKRQIPKGGPPGFPPMGVVEIPGVTRKSHKSNITIINPSQADWALLGANKSVILSPESIEGPFYVQGEQIRKNLKENEKGIDLHLDIQVIDINTCRALKDIAVEIWAANSTGVYTGVIGEGNGNVNDTANINNQALRGVQITGADGSVGFETIFPGYYDGRAVHTHLATHLDITKNPNNTISGGRTAHVGQIYYDQDLIDQIAEIRPYNENKMDRTLNTADFLLAASATNGSDPIVEYVLLGKDVKQGVFAWINFGIDAKAKISMFPATLCTTEGCKVNPAAKDFQMPPGLPPGGFPGGFPKGFPKGPPKGPPKGTPKGLPGADRP